MTQHRPETKSGLQRRVEAAAAVWVSAARDGAPSPLGPWNGLQASVKGKGLCDHSWQGGYWADPSLGSGTQVAPGLRLPCLLRQVL